eukprot:CAMPEP_0182487096 /NCGR_PEP_ID=MMETSP1319-20130603/47730_1 /TAXON_ID=172717 /ORGANISM="Bolidomonas pacifica, Strain RCC208" /LENGTH=72 /DNA_ID=CAMNT_0024689205 /DNA_START=426 /DNA_END=644 /DNA_ORIENTATION=-
MSSPTNKSTPRRRLDDALSQDQKLNSPSPDSPRRSASGGPARDPKRHDDRRTKVQQVARGLVDEVIKKAGGR